MASSSQEGRRGIDSIMKTALCMVTYTGTPSLHKKCRERSVIGAPMTQAMESLLDYVDLLKNDNLIPAEPFIEMLLPSRITSFNEIGSGEAMILLGAMIPYVTMLFTGYFTPTTVRESYHMRMYTAGVFIEKLASIAIQERKSHVAFLYFSQEYHQIIANVEVNILNAFQHLIRHVHENLKSILTRCGIPSVPEERTMGVPAPHAIRISIALMRRIAILVSSENVCEYRLRHRRSFVSLLPLCKERYPIPTYALEREDLFVAPPLDIRVNQIIEHIKKDFASKNTPCDVDITLTLDEEAPRKITVTTSTMVSLNEVYEQVLEILEIQKVLSHKIQLGPDSPYLLGNILLNTLQKEGETLSLLFTVKSKREEIIVL